ncbi:MAG: hypothetical protein EA377_10180 [Phycisphaerales bacterium]|nr:MAG: hypothetical protein EA377_10180 [Phycisphaerales bacterium]
MPWYQVLMEFVERLGLAGILGAAVGTVVTLLVKARIDRKTESRRRIEEKRCNSISNVYAALYDMQVALELYSTPDCAGDELEKRAESFHDAANKFREIFQHDRFWFDDDSCALLDEIWTQYKATGYTLVEAEMNIDFVENRKKAREFVQRKIPEIRKKLEEDIRRIIRGFE